MSDPNTLENEVQELMNKFAGPITLQALSKVVQEELAGKLTLDDVVDKVEELSSDDYNKPLSARQGKLLKDLIDNIKVCDMDISAEDIVLIKKWIAMNHDEFLTISHILSSLENTDGMDLNAKVASAALVKTINTTLTSLVNSLQGEVTSLTEKVESLEGEKETLQETVESLQSKNEELEGKVSNLTEKVTAAEGKIESLESANSSLESQVEELQGELNSFEEMSEEEVEDIWNSAKEELGAEP